MSEEKKKKVIRKHVSVKKFELVNKRIEKSIYNKFQLLIAKIFSLQLQEDWQYMFNVQYTGTTRLKVNDIVYTNNGTILVCVKEQNRLALLVTRNGHKDKPSLHGRLTILEDK